jgi:hypothetical protein
MTHPWDEFSKSLAEHVPRRESLRRLGVVVAGVVFGPLGWRPPLARGPDPCKAFCNQCPTRLRSQCLSACRACNPDTGRLCGSCGRYFCCGNGQTCCGEYCADLASNFYNCGACGHVCPQPGPYEYGFCVNGNCVYPCVEGAVRCDGTTCTSLEWDPDNCGACGNSCGDLELCVSGSCRDCNCYGDGVCQDLFNDPSHCGACGFVCPAGYGCFGGVCGGEPYPPGVPPY